MKNNKIRMIKKSYYTNRGSIPTKKSAEGEVWFEYLREEGLLLQLIHDPNCIKVESQSIPIPNIKEGNNDYYPDIYAEFKDGVKYIYDVKEQKYLDDLKVNIEEAQRWEDRKKCIEEYCQKKGIKYQIITENEIWNERYNNVEFFRKNKRKPRFLIRIKSEIVKNLNENSGMTRIDLSIKISKKMKLDVKEIIPVIDHLIYLDFFQLNFEEKIEDNTELYLRLKIKSKIIPLYQYFLKVKNKPQQLTTFTNKSEKPNQSIIRAKNFSILPEKIRDLILHRKNLLRIFDSENFSTENLKSFASKNDVGVTTLYQWRKDYQQFGWPGLIPQFDKRGRKKGFDPEIEELMSKVIKEHYLTPNQPSKSGSYRFLVDECVDRNPPLIPPSKKTFFRRIDEISNITITLYREGKKALRHKYSPLEGIHPYGNHPLDTIEFDHTPLDIMIAAYHNGESYSVGRAWLTIAIDIYSRMIYGYYLSFDNPSILTVGMCFLTGIMQKDQLIKKYKTINDWPINGLPKRIILDNALEFTSEALSAFCKLYDIEIQFNPPGKPEKKPFVERIFRTINETIRDTNLPGYAPPQKVRKDTGYNPETTAALTIEDFEKWLVKWIVDEYHQRIHTGIKKKEGIEISPQEMYERGLAESKGLTIGLPTIPHNLNQLKLDVLPFQKRFLYRGGIRMFNLEYFDSIITELRNTQKKQKYFIKYDPRDIREIYLWVDDGKNKGYHSIPLKRVFLPELRINPEDPLDYPLSLKELEAIKILRKKKNNKINSPIRELELVKARKERQQIVKMSLKKKKTMKSALKAKEREKLYKEKATSTEINRSLENDIQIKPEVESYKDLFENYQPSDSDINQPEKVDIFDYEPTGLETSKYPNKNLKEV